MVFFLKQEYLGTGQIAKITEPVDHWCNQVEKWTQTTQYPEYNFPNLPNTKGANTNVGTR